jgi:hypothetical protein
MVVKSCVASCMACSEIEFDEVKASAADFQAALAE